MSAIKPKTVKQMSSPRARPRTGPHDGIAERRKVRKLGLKRLHHFTSLLSKALHDGAPEAIHDVRVASRRLQQVLDCLYPPPRPPAIQHLRRRLQSSRRALGKLRDHDVFIGSLESRLQRKRTMHRAVLTAIRERLSKRRAALLRKAVIESGKHDVFDICARLEKILGKADSMAGTARHPVPYDRSPYASLKQPWRDFEKQLAKSLRGAAPANLHKVRIKAKRLRYLLELIRDLGDRSADAPLFWLRRLQQCLGDWHDLEVQEKILLKTSSCRSFPSGPANRDIIAAMISKMRGVKAGLARRYLSMVRISDEQKRLRRWMTSHLVS